jgi:hypothetical protein
MNDLERLRSADPGEDGGIRDKYRDRVINYLREARVEQITMSPRDAVGYITAVVEEDLRQKTWAELIDELTLEVDENEFSVMDLEVDE